MKLLFLTSQTVHHVWYIQKILDFYPESKAIIELGTDKIQLDIQHPFEEKRNQFEKSLFLHNKDITISEIIESLHINNINDKLVLEYIKSFMPDVIIVFGTRKINLSFDTFYENRIVNLHGGDPELYRGLDSHLWSIYHGDYQAIVTTLHYLNDKLDDGNIILKQQLDLKKISHLFELRSLNTQACVDITLSALKMFEMVGTFTSYKQRTKGRYYSHMPYSLKEICVKKFQRMKNVAESC